MKRIVRLSSLFVCLIAVTAHGVQGTRVTSGAFTFASEVGDIDVTGQSGFSMQAGVSAAAGIFAPASQCGDLDCTPGTQVSLFAHRTGSVEVSAPFTFSGQLTPQATGVAEALFGSGVATLAFRQSADGSAWQFASATYQFQRVGSTRQD